MKKTLLLLSLALLSLAAGCVQRAVHENTYDVYFLAQQVGEVPQQALVAERRTLAGGEDPVQGLLDCLLAGPTTEGLIRTIPSSVTLRDWELNNGLLTVDFSGRYGGLSGVSLTLADYSVVLTLSQLEEVETVMITADGDLLGYRDHQCLSAQDVESQVFREEEKA